MATTTTNQALDQEPTSHFHLFQTLLAKLQLHIWNIAADNLLGLAFPVPNYPHPDSEYLPFPNGFCIYFAVPSNLKLIGTFEACRVAKDLGFVVLRAGFCEEDYKEKRKEIKKIGDG